MAPTALSPRRLMIVDDDLLSREVLTLLAAEAGFDVAAFESGEAALESLAAGDAAPEVVLADMQMPGISGDSLARLLRPACRPAAMLVAMSGTEVPPDRVAAFDGFLLKPFAMEDLGNLLDRRAPASASSAVAAPGDVLNRAIYESFARGMSGLQLRQLYAMSLDDADARIEHMRRALEANDPDAYRRAAHSIKGGCGMVGAVELARLASEMEERGPEPVDNIGPLKQFLSASQRLRRILDALQP